MFSNVDFVECIIWGFHHHHLNLLYKENSQKNTAHWTQAHFRWRVVNGKTFWWVSQANT